MDRFEHIFDSFESFLIAVAPLIPIGLLIFGIIMIILKAKRPKINQMQQQYHAQQQYYDPQTGAPLYGQPYGGYPPYPNQPQPQKSSTAVKAVIIGLILYFVVFPIVGFLIIVGLIMGGVSSCNRNRQQQYDDAIDNTALYRESYLPETIDMGSSKLTFLFASEYDIDKEVGDCFAMANRPAQNAYYGGTKGYLVLTDKKGKLMSPKDEYYTNITFEEDITYKGEGVIICTKNLSNGCYTPLSDEFEKSQDFFTAQGKEIEPDKLEYNKNSFSDETKTNPSRNTADTANEEDDYYYVETVGEIYILDKFGKGETDYPKALTDRRDELNRSSGKVIKKQGGEIVFPKNVKFETFDEDYDTNFSLQGQTYSGDIYKKIYAYDIDKGYVSAVKYDKDNDTYTLGLFDLDGKALYTSDLKDGIFVGSRLSNDISFMFNEYIFFKNQNGFDILNTSGEKVRTVFNADTLHGLTDDLFYSDNSAEKQSFTLSSITHPDKDLTIDAKNGAYVDMISDNLICIAKDEVHSYYYLQ
ncbi:MAG: hypothetical protein J6O40_05580 [Ruminococcus sp.]|nr:hypothetical protein [Ruminococcus sp.]